METIIRHWHILRMIPRQTGRITAGQIHDALLETTAASRLTKRTVERDLHELAASFPLQFDGKKPQGWYWRPDAEVLEIPGMDLTTALTFRMVEEYLARLLPQHCLSSLEPHMKRARTVLGNTGHGGLADWPSKVRIVARSQPLIPPAIDPHILQAVYEALLRNQRLKATYGRHGQEAKEYEISPLGLVFNDPVAYVVGTCWEYTDIRLLALHRFTAAEIIATPASHPPTDFDLQRYIDGGAFGFNNQPGAALHLKARFTRTAAAHLWESRLTTDQTISDDGEGWVRVAATVADTQQLRWWLLAFGEQVEVLEPLSLREEFAGRIRQLGRLYEAGM